MDNRIQARMRVSRPLKRRGNTRKAAGLASAGSVDSVKGGGDRWVIMATAMTNALDRMRELWMLLDHLRELHEKSGGSFSHSGNWTPILNEVTAVANILRVGLKAR